MKHHRTGRRAGAASKGAKLLATACVLASALATGARAGDREVPPTNLDLMTRLGTQVAEEVLARIEPEVKGVRLRILPNGNGEEYQLLEDIFERILEARGIEAVSARQSPAAPTPGEGDSLFTLDYKVPVFRLSYPKVFRSHLIGGKTVKREAKLSVTAKLLSGEGDVIWIGDSTADSSDQFPHSDLDRIQEGSYQFVAPEMPGSSWGKVVEPVFVSAIIVGMIYLFFSNQSAN